MSGYALHPEAFTDLDYIRNLGFNAIELLPISDFLCDLPEHYSLRRLVRTVKGRWKIEQDYQQLKEELGLDHYEGRHWTGWHHHVTLVMLAHALLTLEKLRSKKNFWVDPATDAP